MKKVMNTYEHLRALTKVMKKDETPTWTAYMCFLLFFQRLIDAGTCSLPMSSYSPLLFFQRLIDASEKASETTRRHYCHRHCTTKECRGASLQRLSLAPHSQWAIENAWTNAIYTSDKRWKPSIRPTQNWEPSLGRQKAMSPFENVPTIVASTRLNCTRRLPPSEGTTASKFMVHSCTLPAKCMRARALYKPLAVVDLALL